MARYDSSAPSEILQPPLFDRFRVAEGRGEQVHFDGIGIRELKESVARHLEWLLNTRTWPPPEADDFRHLEQARTSLLTFGIPDLSTFSWQSATDATRIAALVEDKIRRFEPRLLARSVKCHIVPNEDASDFTFNFRIEAILNVNPISESVTFDSSAEIDGGGIRIESFG